MQDKNAPTVICGMYRKCRVKKCFHKTRHLQSDACKGMCKHMGYPDCFEVRNRRKKNHKRA